MVDADALVLDPAGVEVDALAFEELVREGSLDALERSAILYQGDLLQGLPAQGPQPSAFEEWLGGERERLRELALEALAKLVNIQRAAESPERALSTALRLLALDPLQEAAHRTAMRLHVQLGRRTAALRQYQACVNTLRRELNVEPEDFGLSCANEPDMKMFGPPPDDHGTGDNPELVACVGATTRGVLAGEMGAARNATVLGAALILKAAGHVLTLAEGVDAATDALDSGAANEVLARLTELV